MLATARKSLRRTRAELPSGGRCERAERALSDRLDGATSAMDERFLDAHLTRCARCRTHELELTAALEELRAELAAQAKPVEEPPPRAHLRIVPPRRTPARTGAARSRSRLQSCRRAGARRGQPPRPLTPPARSRPGDSPPSRRPRGMTRDRIRAALPVAVAVLIAIGLVAAAIALLRLRHNDNAQAPWNAPNAPVVHPPPLSDQ